jgi:hypothetical protein
MAYCDPLDTGLSPFCGPNLGGVVEAWIADYDKVGSVTVSTQSVVTAISMTQSGIFYQFEFREDTSSFAQTNTPTLSADIVEQVGTLVFQQLSTVKRNAFNLLRGKKLVVVYKDANGQYWLSGKNLGVRLTNLEQNSGADRGDDNIWTVTLTARETEFAYEVQSGVIIAPNFP